jgi:hypothetical protein
MLIQDIHSSNGIGTIEFYYTCCFLAISMSWAIFNAEIELILIKHSGYIIVKCKTNRNETIVQYIILTLWEKNRVFFFTKEKKSALTLSRRHGAALGDDRAHLLQLKGAYPPHSAYHLSSGILILNSPVQVKLKIGTSKKNNIQVIRK